MGLNLVGYFYHGMCILLFYSILCFRPRLLTAPIIMMSQNRQSERDRMQAQADYQTNIEAKQEIEALTIILNKLDIEKLDKIITMLEEMKKK